MPHESPELMILLVALVKTIITGLGGLITYYAFKAYRRTRDRSLALLASGFGCITVGAIIAGISFEIIGVPLAVGVVIDGLFVIIGFGLIAYSLHTGRS